MVQILLELLFMGGAFAVALRHKVFPKIPWKYVVISLGLFVVFGGVGWFFFPDDM